MSSDRIGSRARFDATTLDGLKQQLNAAFQLFSAGAGAQGGLRLEQRETPSGAPEAAGSPNLVLATSGSVQTLSWWNGTAWVQALTVGHTHSFAEITGTIANAQVPASAVTQHQAALIVAWSQLTGVPSTFAPSAHVHSGADITTGTVGDARLSSNVPLKNAANTFTQIQRLESAFPAIYYRDTDLAVDASGLWSVTAANGSFQVYANTSAAGDFSTIQGVLVASTGGTFTYLGNTVFHAGNTHTHPASQITAGAFGAGNYAMAGSLSLSGSLNALALASRSGSGNPWLLYNEEGTFLRLYDGADRVRIASTYIDIMSSSGELRINNVPRVVASANYTELRGPDNSTAIFIGAPSPAPDPHTYIRSVTGGTVRFGPGGSGDIGYIGGTEFAPLANRNLNLGTASLRFDDIFATTLKLYSTDAALSAALSVPTAASMTYGSMSVVGVRSDYTGFRFSDSYQNGTLLSKASASLVGWFEQTTSLWLYYFTRSSTTDATFYMLGEPMLSRSLNYSGISDFAGNVRIQVGRPSADDALYFEGRTTIYMRGASAVTKFIFDTSVGYAYYARQSFTADSGNFRIPTIILSTSAPSGTAPTGTIWAKTV